MTTVTTLPSVASESAGKDGKVIGLYKVLKTMRFSNCCVVLLSVTWMAAGVRAGDRPPGEKPHPPAKLDPSSLPLFETKYYLVHTDLDAATAKEACIRMTRMAEEYHTRTAGFAGAISLKLPFYLFKSAEEYYAAGGPPQTAGIFDGHRLMAMGDRRLGGEVWHVVQHEGFHQFVHAVIGGDIPIWVNEGMAEYFGEGVFTGDGFITGVIPEARMQRVIKTMGLSTDAGGFSALRSIMGMSHRTWNLEMKQQNYDQAWSMVQFLAHGDNGKYQSAFGNYMSLVSKGGDSDESWNSTFGSDAAAFDARWREYWKSLPANPTGDLYLKATVSTLTSFLARAFAVKQTFTSFDTFVEAAKAKSLRNADDDWLPPSLLESALRRLETETTAGDKFSLIFTGAAKVPSIACESVVGQHLTGKFVIKAGHVTEVNVTVSDAKHPSHAMK